MKIEQKAKLGMIGNSNVNDYIYAYISGIIPTPEQYYIGKLCMYNHGFDGKSVRYVSSDTCISCERIKQRKRISKKNKSSEDSIKHKKLMDMLEDKKMIEELGL